MWSALSKDLAEFTQNIRSDTGNLVGAVARLTTEAATRLKGGQPFAGDDAFTESSCLLFDDGAAGDTTLLALQESDATYLRPLRTNELVSYNKWNPEQRNLCDSREIQQELLDRSDAVYDRYLRFVVCGADEEEEEGECDRTAEMEEDDEEDDEHDVQPPSAEASPSSRPAGGASDSRAPAEPLNNSTSRASSPLQPLVHGGSLPEADLDEIPLDHDVFFTRYFFRLRELRRAVGMSAEARNKREEEQQRRQRAAASAGISSSYASAVLQRTRDSGSESSDWDDEGGDASASKQKPAEKGQDANARATEHSSGSTKNHGSLSEKRQAEIMAMIREGEDGAGDDGSDAWDDCDLPKQSVARNDGSAPQSDQRTDSSSNATMITNTAEIASPVVEGSVAEREKALAVAQERIAELEATVRRLEAELEQERQKNAAYQNALLAHQAGAALANREAAVLSQSPSASSKIESSETAAHALPQSPPSAPINQQTQSPPPPSLPSLRAISPGSPPSFLTSPEHASHRDPTIATHSAIPSPSNPTAVPQEAAQRDRQTAIKELKTGDDAEEDDWSGWA